jgi:outer membrane protein W
MNRITQSTISGSLVFLAILAGGHAAAASDGSDTGWRLKLTAASLQSTGGGGFNSSLGAGLGFEYRASDHFGFEIGAVSSQVKDELGLSFGDQDLSIASTFRVTPVLARLNFHLTPGHKADLYLGPVAGWVRYGDIDVRLNVPGEGSVLADHVKNKNGFAGGVHIGLDVPFGTRGFFFTSDATYLKAKVKPASSSDGAGSFDLDPLIVQAGIGLRF